MTWAFLVDSVPFTKAVIAGDTSLGGSESACLGLARALKARGHEIHIFTTQLAQDAYGGDASGLVWHPAEHFERLNQWIEWDVVVALRSCLPLASPVYARLRLLWNQDLLLPGVGGQIMAIAWALDHLVYVSEYHRKQWEGEQKELQPIGWVTKNGYDPTLLPGSSTKDPKRIIHISRPERGLGPLLKLWPLLKKQVPDATLEICRYSSMYDPLGWGEICKSYDDAVTQVNEHVGGITYLGELSKPALYKAISDAAVMWYPGVAGFAETSCIAAIEAQACGTPFVGSFRGALPETVKPSFDAGLLIRGDAERDEVYAEASVSAVVELLDGCQRQSFQYRRLQLAGKKHVEAYTFDVLAAEWEAQVETWFTERYASHKVGIMRSLLHDDDHVGADRVARDIAADFQPSQHGLSPDETPPLLREAFVAMGFCDRVIKGLEQGAEDYAAHAIQDPLDEVKLSGRFQAVIPHFKDCTHVLDVACGNGSFAIALALANPTVRVFGLDYAAHNITLARDAAERAGVADRCQFGQATVYDFDRQAMHTDWTTVLVTEDFDGLFVGEFVEHVAECALLIDALEKAVMPGAQVVYTCPMGPFGELVPRGQPIQRGHVHSFAHDDIKEVWGQKLKAAADFFEVGVTPRGVPIGHWIIHYTTAPNRQARPRDLANRTKRTRPLQKLSAGLITRNAELDLARCLDTVYGIVDEIVIGDTGSTDDTKAIAAKFGARVIDLDPIRDQPEGFSSARNAVLEACTGDWFLWIDADEMLFGAHLLRRYLDGPVFHGFVIHQNHLQLDAPPHYDIPVRLFRKSAPIRFYGCVHEQPQWGGDQNKDIYPTLDVADLTIAHTGYMTEGIRQEKMLQRNRPLLILDQKVNPTRVLSKLLLLRETALQADALLKSGGAFVDRAKPGFAYAIQIFLAHFTDPGHKFHQLARPWYELALRGLGLGYEMEIAIAGKHGPLGSSSAKPERIWVRDADEFETLLTWKIKAIRERMLPHPVHTEPYLVETPAAADEVHA